MFDSAINWYNGTPNYDVIFNPNSQIFEYAPSSQGWNNIAYGNGIFVALSASSGDVIWSSDGVMWQYGNNVNGSFGFSSIAFGNGRFVAVGNPQSGSTYSAIFYSTDGTNWIFARNNFSLLDLTFGAGRFVGWTYGASATPYFSTDGITWTAASTTGTLPQSMGPIMNVGSQFRSGAGFASRYQRSDNSGSSWYTVGMPALGSFEEYFYSAAGNVAINNQGAIQPVWVFLVRGNVATNKFAWARGTGSFALGTLPSTQLWTSLVFGGDRFIASAHGSGDLALGQINRSTSQLVWTTQVLPQQLYNATVSIAWGGGRFVAIDNKSLKTAYSIDGINWTQSESLPSLSKLSLNSIYPFSLSNILNVPSEFI
jgi:hypothetical protein